MEEQYKFVCEKCNYKTNINNLMKRHKTTILHKTGIRGKRKKTGKIKIYKCDKCSYKTINNNNYLTHVLNNHSTKKLRKEKFKYYCKRCDFGVFTESCFNKHLLSKSHNRRSKKI